LSENATTQPWGPGVPENGLRMMFFRCIDRSCVAPKTEFNSVKTSVKKLEAGDPTVERVLGDGSADSLRASKIGNNFRFPHAGVGFFKSGDDGLHISGARSADYVILIASGEREDGMTMPSADFDDTGVEAETLDLPVVGIGQSVKRWNNDSA
jgi:hypothetical protein